MKKRTLAAFLVTLMVVSVLGLASTSRAAGEQLPPPIQWEKTYSGQDDTWLIGSVHKTTDGGYIAAARRA